MAEPDKKDNADKKDDEIPETFQTMPGSGGTGQQIPSQPRTFSPIPPSPKEPKPANVTPPPASEYKEPETQRSNTAPPKQATGAGTGTFPKPSIATSKAGPVHISGGGGTSALRPQPAAPAAGQGGDTIRLRVNPKPGAGAISGPPKSSRQRLPDIRRRQTAKSTIPTYGPFSIFFGFLWLIFKMIFFTALVLALGIGLGYAILWWYIKTPEVTVPNVRGMKIAEAFEVLSEKKLGMIKVRSESSGLVAPGEIVEQAPPAGSVFKSGRAVGVVISSGRSKFTVPNVVGESIENARNKIRGANLEVGTELRMEDANVPKEAVISQQPAANTGLDEAAKVDLLVSAGPPGKGLTMPNVTGVTYAEARAALSRLGMTDIVTDPPGQPDGTVAGQEPLVGKSILQTDKVTLKLRK